jgi:DNA-binding response OmpR family regulator
MKRTKKAGIAPTEVLIVDDDKAVQLTIKFAVQSANYQVRTASGGHEALKLVQEKAPDIILLDLVMPELDGYEVCRRLKAAPGSAKIPVIFLSGLVSAEEKVKAFEAGGIDYIVKPCSTIELIVRLRTHLTLQRIQNSLAAEVRKRTRELKQRNQELLETNMALKRLLHGLEEEKQELTQVVFKNVNQLILPDLNRMVEAPIQQRRQLRDTIHTNLQDLPVPVTGEHIEAYWLLTPTELRILNCIRQGSSSKEIAKMLNVSSHTVATHRKNIRKKMNICGKKINLTTFISQLK